MAIWAHKKFYKSEKWHELRRFDNDDEYFLLHCCPNIHKKVREALENFTRKLWQEEVVQQLDQTDLYLPDEIYDDTDPDFLNTAQDY